MSGAGEVPPGVEEQDVAAEAVHDAGATARPHDVRREVSRRDLRPRLTSSQRFFPCLFPLFADLNFREMEEVRGQRS